MHWSWSVSGMAGTYLNLSLKLSLLLLTVGARSVLAQDYDFSAPIKCYSCDGDADNSKCADPVGDDMMTDLDTIQCDRGMCLKWTKYRDGKLQMIRTCTRNVNFHLTMIDGVCRTERNGNGYLCMCGKSMCNSAPKTLIPSMGRTFSHFSSFWLMFGFLFALPHWIFQTLWRESPW